MNRSTRQTDGRKKDANETTAAAAFVAGNNNNCATLKYLV